METRTETLRHAMAERRESGGLIPVAPDVVCVQLPIVNVYFVEPAGGADRSWVLVDAGLSFSRSRIEREALRRFGPGSRPAAILLTHGHFDHVGALKQLAAEWDVEVYAHELELPYLTGKSPYPPPDPTVGGGGMALMSPLYPRGPIDLHGRVRPLPEDGSVPGMPGWRWIHTPGHTAGHVSFFRESDRLLIAGDAFVTTRQESLLWALAQPEEVNGPPAYFTPDWVASRRSVEALAALEPEIAATGHGRPMSGELMRQELHTLARNFESLAVPHHGRYVRQPAVADWRGVVSVPPSRVSPQLLAGAGLAAGFLTGFLLALRGERQFRSGRSH